MKILASIYKRHEKKQYEINTTYKIPKTLHFIWLGPKNFPAKSVQFVRSWLAHHPDWDVIFWTDRERLVPCKQMQVRYVADFQWKHLQHFYDKTVNWAEKSDYLRYEVLSNQGGIYVDHDVYCYESLDKLAQNYHFFCGLELPHLLIQGCAITPCNALLGAASNHPILDEVIKCIKLEWENDFVGFHESRFSEYELVMNRSYMPLTYAIKAKILTAPGENIVFPAAYFYSKEPLPTIYSTHNYAATWGLSNQGKCIQKNIEILKTFATNIRNKQKLIKRLLLINGVMAICLFFLLFKLRKKTA